MNSEGRGCRVGLGDVVGEEEGGACIKGERYRLIRVILVTVGLMVGAAAT